MKRHAAILGLCAFVAGFVIMPVAHQVHLAHDDHGDDHHAEDCAVCHLMLTPAAPPAAPATAPTATVTEDLAPRPVRLGYPSHRPYSGSPRSPPAAA
jgi:hypothetical protein